MNDTTYWMNSLLDDKEGYWEPCKASSLEEAKREAEARFGFLPEQALIKVATGDNKTAFRVVLANRRNDGSPWISMV